MLLLIYTAQSAAQVPQCEKIKEVLDDFESYEIDFSYRELEDLDSSLSTDLLASSACLEQLFELYIAMFDYSFNNSWVAGQVKLIDRVELLYPDLTFDTKQDSIKAYFLLEYARGDLAATFNQQEIAVQHYLNTLIAARNYKMNIADDGWRDYNFALQNIANTYISLGRYQSALEYAQQALDHATEVYKLIDNQPYNSMRLSSIAEAYKGLGNKSKYNEIIGKVATEFKNDIDLEGDEYARRNMYYMSVPFRDYADACLDDGRLAEAFDYVQILDQYGSKTNTKELVYNLLLKARYQNKSGRSASSHSAIQRALDAIRQQKTKIGWTYEVSTRLQKAKFYLWDQEYANALEQLSMVDDIMAANQERGDIIYGYREHAMFYKAQCYIGLDKGDQAFTVLLELTGSIKEKMRGSLRLSDHLIKIESYYPWLELALDTWWLIDEKEADSAFQILETIKSLDLFKQLALAIDTKNASPEVVSLLRENQQNIFSSKKAIALGDTSFMMKSKIIELTLESDRIKKGIRSNENREVILREIDLGEYQSEMMDSSAHLLFFSGDQHYYSMLVTSTTNDVNRISRHHLDTVINLYLDQVAAPTTAMQADQIGRKLGELLSVDEYLSKDISRLLVSPDGLLHLIPFGALKDRSNKFWIEKLSITYTPSAHLQNFIESKLPPIGVDNSALYLPHFSGDKIGLSFSKKEAQALCSLLPNETLYENIEASKDSFLARSENHQLIHLMTHAFSEDASDKDPYILMGSQSDSMANFMTMAEIKNLSLNAELVGLSACETSSGRIHNGEGVFSLSTAFLGAGSRSTIGTMWAANDQSTQMIMTEFYKYVGKMPKDKALQKAKLSYLSDYHGTDYQHPYYWAGIALSGSRNTLHLSTEKSPILKPAKFLFIAALLFGSYFIYTNRRTTPK